jgi:RHS repeat-associated protein
VTGPTEHHAYHYDDGRGALTSITDELNAGAVAATFTVDAAGHVKGETRGGTIKTYDWDAEGRLRSVEVRPPAPGAPWTASYAYGHSGRRVSKSGPAGVTSYLWGAGELVSETPAGGTALVYQQLGDLAVAVGGEQLMHDGLGSVVGRIGAGAPTLYRYDAWGGFRSSDAPATGQPSLAYAGQHWDGDAGLSYAQQRWYDPGTGFFLSEDPVGATAERLREPSRLQTFAYAGGNPVTNIDPGGTDWFSDMLRAFQPQPGLPPAYANAQRAPAAAAVPTLQAADKAIRFGEGVAIGVGTGTAVVGACALAPPLCKVAGGVALAGVFTSGQPTLRALDQQIGACVPGHDANDARACGETVGFVATLPLAGAAKTPSASRAGGISAEEEFATFLRRDARKPAAPAAPAARSLGAAAADDPALGATEPGTGTSVYRVQGGVPPNASRPRLVVDDAGKLSIQGDDMLEGAPPDGAAHPHRHSLGAARGRERPGPHRLRGTVPGPRA